MAMTDQKRKRIVYAVFIVAVIWGLYNQPWNRPNRGVQTDNVPVTVAATVVPTAAGTAVVNGAASAHRPAVEDWQVDPFRTFEQTELPSMAPEEVDHAMPVLKGTMVIGERRLCVVDDRVYRAGQQVRDWTIVEIGQGEVLMRGPAGQTVQLVAADRETGE